MRLSLNVYTDESLTEIKRVVEAEELKIPYRVTTYIIQSLDNISLDNEADLLKLITGNIDKLDKIMKATFGVSESELDCISTTELIDVAKELYDWTIGKVKSLKGSDEKNAATPV